MLFHGFVSAMLSTYANDVKLYPPIESDYHSNHLQNNIDIFAIWCWNDKQVINNENCKEMTFVKQRNDNHYYYYYFPKFTYCIYEHEICQVSNFTALGILFNNFSKFNDKINDSSNPAHWILGFVLRDSQGLEYKPSSLLVYGAYVNRKLEYFPVVFPLRN